MTYSPVDMVAEVFRSDLCAFIQRSFFELNPATRYRHNWHLELLAAKLEEVRQGKCRRLIINIPPRHLKSHAVSIAFPAWVLGHDSTKRILSVTYAQDFSDTLARHSRNLMSSPFYQSLFKTRQSRGRGAVHDYETTSGGYRLSTSVGGVLTGQGADLIIIDDPLKADEALSETRRKAVNSWYDNTLRSRLNNQETGAIVIVMQRLHANDLVAHVQEHEHWDVVALPAIAELDEIYEFETPYGHATYRRKAGDILQPSLISAFTLESHKRAMTDYNFAAQYQQNPQPERGVIVQRDWLKFYHDEDKPKQFDIVLQSWDTAVKDTELANFSVCTTWGIKNAKAYLLHVFRKKLEFPNLKKAVKDLAAFQDATVVLVEDKSSGSSLIQELRASGMSIVQPSPVLEGDKIMRLRARTAQIEGGSILFPDTAGWREAYLSELLSFPNSKYDDQVDSTVFALAWISENSKLAGAFIKRSWIHYYTSPPEDVQYRRVFTSWDTALSGGGQNDWTVCTVWALINNIYYLLDMDRGIYEYPALRQRFIELNRKYRSLESFVEETTTGIALKNDYDLRLKFPIRLVPIEQDRKGRVYVLQRAFKEGLVRFPMDAPFMPLVEKELLSYPGGATDDIVDSISQAIAVGGKGYDASLSWV